MSIKVKFLDPYIEDDFYSKIISVLLYDENYNDAFQLEDTLKYIKKFTNELELDITTFHSSKLNNFKQLKKLISKLINVRSDTTLPNINYENIKKLFPDLVNSYHLSGIIDKAVDEFKITSSQDYSSSLNTLVESVSIYNQLKLLDDGIIELDNYINDDEHKNTSMLNKIQEFKNIIDGMYHRFSEVNFQKENNVDDTFWYFDDSSAEEISIDTCTYLKDSFVVFKTGFPFVDDNIFGITSGKTYIIAAPSNHGKSLMMVNLVKNLIELNGEMFNDDKKDVILYYTLEDDKYNTQKRAISIYGNLEPNFVRDVHYFFREKKNSKFNTKFQEFFGDILKSSIIASTNGKVNLIIKQAEEGTTSIKTVIQDIEKLKFKGYNVKFVAIDYIEAMVPSIVDHVDKNDPYFVQGQIVKEMRRLSRLYKIPVLTASQLQRYADDTSQELKNSLMGDSKRKVDYADFIIMLRQSPNIAVESDEVMRFVTSKQENTDIEINEYGKYGFAPIQVAVTKAKDGKLSGTHYVLKCDKNLRIESDIDTAVLTSKQAIKTTNLFKQKFEKLTSSNISFDLQTDVIGSLELF